MRVSALLCLLLVESINAFGIVDPMHVLEASSSLVSAKNSILTTAATAPVDDLLQLPHVLFQEYLQALRTDPLPTQMTTGVVLAVAGDAVAQLANNDEEGYNLSRATSLRALMPSIGRPNTFCILP